jgi:alpha-L-rhamnosidase
VSVLVRSLSISILLLSSFAAWAGPGAPARLRTEYIENPAVIDTPAPRFSWVLEHTERGQKQTAYQIQVGASPRFETADAWDSGNQSSGASSQIEYAGKPLASDVAYFWRVRYWDAAGVESPWSQPASFHTGLLNASDWKAKWITGGTLLRRSFTLAAPVKRARVFVAATGYYELHIDGHRVGHHVLDPGWTDFRKRVLYSAYDVTANLAPGRNAVAVLLGRGWFTKALHDPPNLILQLEGEYQDGSPFSIVSDSEWQSFESPITMDDIYDGETYDARKEHPGWDTADFDESGAPCAAANLTGVTLSAQAMPAIEVVDTLLPHKISQPRAGVYVFDFEQNFSGWAALRASGEPGEKIRIRYAETLNPDGTLNTENLRGARATDTYILRGGGSTEHYEPRFTYHGFRYVEITGLTGAPTLATVRGREVHTAVASVGGFSSSNQMLNDLQSAMAWGIKTNLASVPTDCDQRDERLGWMGDAHLSAETAIFNFDMAAFYDNFLRDIRDSQGEGGEVPNIVPYITRFNPNRVGDPAWSAAYAFIYRFVYENYGDRRALAEHYEGVKALADFLTKHAPQGIIDYAFFGDWVPVDATPKEFAGTWAYIEVLDTVAWAADILGKKSDREVYLGRLTKARDALYAKYYDASGHYTPGTQAAQVLGIAAQAGPPEATKKALSYLVDRINYHDNAHLTTGILATKYLWPVLAAGGQPDLAYDVLTRPDYPGYGFMLSHGATTLWELWQERTGPKMNSHNHHMFASVGTFLYRTLAGINEVKPGYDEIRIAPFLAHGLDWASASTETIRGEVATSWHRIDTGYALDVTIPVGSSATVILPKLELGSPVVTESGQAIFAGGAANIGPAGVGDIALKDDRFELKIGSGTYHFKVGEQE